MNYIELINKFWELDEAWQFRASETRLYFYLLKVANRLGWAGTFYHGDDKTAANVGISKTTLKSARLRLTKAGLITFGKGGKGYGRKTRYLILMPDTDPAPPLNKQKPNTEKETGKEKIKRFSPPSLREVREYCEKRNNNVEPQKFIDFYTAKNWMIGKNKMKNWEAALRTWEHRDKCDRHKHPAASQHSKQMKDDRRW